VRLRWLLGVVLSSAAVAAWAQVEVRDAWVRATVPAQKASGAFMQLTAERDTRLVQVRTPVAGVAEVHEMVMVDNVMRMRAVDVLELPAGKPVQLSPGGYHLMLMDLKQQLKDGDQVPFTLVFEDKDKRRQELAITVPVRPIGAAGGHRGAMKH